MPLAVIVPFIFAIMHMQFLRYLQEMNPYLHHKHWLHSNNKGQHDLILPQQILKCIAVPMMEIHGQTFRVDLPSVNWVGIVSDEFFSSDELVFIAGGNYVYYKKACRKQTGHYLTAHCRCAQIFRIFLFTIMAQTKAYCAYRNMAEALWEIPMSELRAVSSEFIASNLLPCIGDSVQFSDLSNGNTISRTWTFTGGSPSTSTLSNPKVAYASIGTYDVTLTVNDALGNATTTKTAYINTAGSNAAVNEGFENTFLPVNWTEQDANNDNNKWQWFTSTGGFGASYKCAYFNNYDQQTNGAWDEMRTQKIDLNGYKHSIANIQPYGYPYSDTLEVLISTNCGNTYSQIYIKGGSTLATVGGNNSDAFVPTSLNGAPNLFRSMVLLATG